MHNKKVIISDLDNTLISWDSKKRYKRIEQMAKEDEKSWFRYLLLCLIIQKNVLRSFAKN